MKKRVSAIPLRWRITLLSGAILIIFSFALTFFSMWNAQNTLLPYVGISTPAYDLVEQREDGATAAIETIPAMQAEAKLNFDKQSILICFGLSFLGMLAIYYITGKALKPVRLLSEEIAHMDEHCLSTRLQEASTKDEVGELTIGFNHMLERLEDAFLRQKQFTANAAHELKTPLAMIKTGIQVLQRNESSTLQEYRENAHITEESVDRLAQVVNDLLLISSVERANTELSEEIMLDAMLEVIIDEIEPLYQERQIQCQLECETLVIHGNATLLYRAFSNLIENAFKYSLKFGTVQIRSYKSQEGKTVVSITNAGEEMTEENLSMIFEPFYRVDQSRSRKIAGSGLGLSIVKNIVELHHAEVRVKIEKRTICFEIEFQHS